MIQEVHSRSDVDMYKNVELVTSMAIAFSCGLRAGGPGTTLDEGGRGRGSCAQDPRRPRLQHADDGEPHALALRRLACARLARQVLTLFYMLHHIQYPPCEVCISYEYDYIIAIVE